MTVGRMPTIIMWSPSLRARSSAWLRLSRICPSNSDRTPPSSMRGAMLISMLNWPSSVTKSGSAMRSSTRSVRERRIAGLVGEVELDLEADRAAVGVEARLGEHPREDVEAAAHLLAIALAVLAAEDLRFDLLAHEARSLPVIGPTHAKRLRGRLARVR